MITPKQPTESLFLGIECGGTHSVALLAKDGSTEAVQHEAGPANIRLLTDPQLVSLFRELSAIHKKSASPKGIAIGMAGARTEADRERIRSAAGKVWPGVSCYVTNDLETALSAAASPNGKDLTRVLILSGTGSCCFGATPDGKSLRVGGWGHILGDKASGYEIALRALKAVVYYYDRDGKWPALGQRFLQALRLNVPNELIDWAQKADKTTMASFAPVVFKAWAQKDNIASDIIEAAAESLANDGATCAARLVKKGTPVQFVLGGSVLLKQPRFVALIERKLKALWPKTFVTCLERESVWGAVQLARKHFGNGKPSQPLTRVTRAAIGFGKSPVISSDLPVTERRNPLSVNFDRLPVEDMISLMLREDEKIPGAIFAHREKIAQAVRHITTAFKRGGRLFYIGAGTSGRIGVLDASECPPTFRTPPEMIQGIMAGGHTALWKAVEGAEDDAHGGAEALRFANVTKKDVVVGIAASGRTPFVWGALQEAKQRKATTVLVCFNPSIQVEAKHRPKIIIAPDVGPEVLTGSTRLKAGTATKLILNMLTTLSMVKIGKIVSNLMVDMHPSNAKLRDRAIRIVRDITGVDSDSARHALEKSHWIIKDALKRLPKSMQNPVAVASAGLGATMFHTSSSSGETGGTIGLQV